MLTLSLLCLLWGVSLPAIAGDQLCLDCHADPELERETAYKKGTSVFVDTRIIAASIHEGVECAECHAGATDDHPERLPAAQCASCHEEDEADYQAGLHGMARKAGVEDAPTCASCHGTHQILPAADPRSLVHPRKLAHTCDICHGKPDFKRTLKSGRVQSLYVDRAQLEASVHAGKQCGECHTDVVEIPHAPLAQPVDCIQCHYATNTVGAPGGDIYQKYRQSTHGRAAAAGDPRAPACQDCHGTHRILRHEDPEAQVSRARVSQMCGQCHLEVFAQYRTSIHGIELEKGNPDVPTCTGCHSEHDIRSPEDPGSLTHVENISQTCSVCHAAEGIVGKYGIPLEQVETYSKSFHGVAIRFGMRTVANCASCHGVHDIRPPEDPTSSVHLSNIPQTCGKCHPGANIHFAQGKIHLQPQNPDAGIVYYVSSFFKWLTILTICGLVAHILLDLFGQVRQRWRVR